MRTKILMTQCLQADFVKPITKYEYVPLPNLLHLGYAESLRLMGEDAATGPVQKLIAWAYARSESELTVIHVRDRHDPKDPGQAAHLEHFGVHCAVGTSGAELAFRFHPGVFQGLEPKA